MKTNMFKLMTLLLCLGGVITIHAQGLYNIATLDEEEGRSPLRWSAGVDFSYDDIPNALDDGVGWSDSTLGGGVGFGWEDTEGTSETSYCIGVEYLYRITGERQNPNGAGYIGAFANYHGSSSDNFDESALKAGIKYSYFDRISALNKVQLIYGAKAFYETGSRDFSGFEEDVTGFGACAYTGVNFRINNRVSVGFEIPVLNYNSRTFSSNGSEFSSDSFSVAINKDNPIMATARFGLTAPFGGKDSDGDDIDDQDDECPDVFGLPEFNGCPDTDADGIPDKDDKCPEVAGPEENEGCPKTNE